MNLNKKATSIVEAMVVMLIVVSWVVWMYKIYDESINLSVSINNKIKAIQIAKQWIEAVTNMRDTNWLIYSSDYNNCWNTLNYDSGCIWDDTNTNGTDIEGGSSYIIYQSPDNRWEMDKYIWAPLLDYKDLTYRTYYKVWIVDWIYTQTWVTSLNQTIPLFTREIQFSYSWSTHLNIISIIQRSDSSSTQPHSIELEQTLTNWKR